MGPVLKSHQENGEKISLCLGFGYKTKTVQRTAKNLKRQHTFLERLACTWRNAKPRSQHRFPCRSSSRYFLESILVHISLSHSKANKKKITIFIDVALESKDEDSSDRESNRLAVWN